LLDHTKPVHDYGNWMGGRWHRPGVLFAPNQNRGASTMAMKYPGALALVLAATWIHAGAAFAATCTVVLPEYAGKRSGECVADEPSNTNVIYDAEYWGQRGRKLLVPLNLDGRKPGSLISIAPTDVRSNDVAHVMAYQIVVTTRKGTFRFEGQTPTTTYRATVPPSLWRRQRPDERVDYDHPMTSAQMLAEVQALKPVGPALDWAVVEKVISQNQILADRRPTLVGITSDAEVAQQAVPARPGAAEGGGRAASLALTLGAANQARKPVSSPALEQLIKLIPRGGQ
jgi:hypothetical protein